MKNIRRILEFRLSDDSFDARLGQLACYLAGIAIIPVAAVAILKHAGSRADIFLGFGSACLLGLLLILLGILSRRNAGLRGRVTSRSLWPEFASYLGCIGTLVVGIGLLSDLGMSPAQITLGLLVTCSLSISVLELGMTTTLVRSPGDRSSVIRPGTVPPTRPTKERPPGTQIPMLTLVPGSATDRLAGTLLGTALGDALGLPAEGMSARAISSRFGRVDRFRLLGKVGFVSDDTEQAALVAQSLARHPDDVDLCVRTFRRSLLGWFCRLPWGIGRATIRSCIRIAVGVSPSGVMSAGNGAAMRAGIVGAYFHDRPAEREVFGRALADVTHRDVRAIEGALYVAEMAAACTRSTRCITPAACQEEARRIVTDVQLGEAIDRARGLPMGGASTTEAATACGTSGFVVHTLAFATFCFVRSGDDPLVALAGAISAGGDTDSIGAILGGWLGAMHGDAGLPGDLIGRIHDGPFGPTHLRLLANCLAQIREGRPCPAPKYSTMAALARNLALYPVILGHGFRRMVPL